jgi:hypothetical protein
MAEFVVNRRSGLPSIVKTAHTLCRLITLFSPYIQKLYPTNTALQAALAAALAACAVLGEEAEAAIEPGV